MTNTDTADVTATTKQVAELAHAGSELVRITVNTDEAAAAVPHIRERLDAMGIRVPLIGDFHFNGHKLLNETPGLRRGTRQDTASIPATWGAAANATRSSPTMIEIALKYGKSRAHRRELGQPGPGSAHPHDG